MVGMGAVLDWIIECHCLCSVPQATATRRYGGGQLWLGDLGCEGVLEADHLCLHGLPQAACGRGGDHFYVLLSC